MTATEAILWSIARSMVVCLLSLLPAIMLWHCICTTRTRWLRRFWMIASVLPFFVPELLIGFTYRVIAARLVNSVTATEALYGILLVCRAVSVAVIALLIMPHSAIHQESIHSWRLLKPTRGHTATSHAAWTLTLLRLQFSGPWRPLVIASCLSCLVSFQEFETAALMQVDRHPIAWTVWLFDAHAAHQPLRNSLSMTFAPLVLEAVLLIPVLLLWAPRQSMTGEPTSVNMFTNPLPARPLLPFTPRKLRIPGHSTANHPAPPQSAAQAFEKLRTTLPAAWLLLALGLFFFWPILSNARPLLAGVSLIKKPSALLTQSLQQILTSLTFAACAALAALRLASVMHTNRRPGKAIMVLLLPGLMGSLVTALILLAAFQLPLLNVLYDTWLPLLLGLTLSVLPRAFLLTVLLHRTFDPAAWHSAQLLAMSAATQLRQSSQLIRWRMRTFAWIAAGTVLSHWCFWDVTATSILHPVQLDPIVTRLYNEMHYGRTEALLLISTIASFAPWLAGTSAALAALAIARSSRMIRVARFRIMNSLRATFRIIANGQTWTPFVANFGINAITGWLTFSDQPTVNIWGLDKAAASHTLGTCFFLPLITCLIATPIIRRQLRSGSIHPISIEETPVWLSVLPTTLLVRALTFGGLTLLIAACPVITAYWLVNAETIPTALFIVVKVTFSVLLGMVVTPLIVIAAQTERGTKSF